MSKLLDTVSNNVNRFEEKINKKDYGLKLLYNDSLLYDRKFARNLFHLARRISISWSHSGMVSFVRAYFKSN